MKPIEAHAKGTRTPGGENYRYWIASNGLWLVKENTLWRAVIPIDGVPEMELRPLEQELTLKEFRIPFKEMARAVEFFRYVRHVHNAEAFLWIVRDEETGEISLTCPSQQNRPAHVHADPDTPPGKQLVGDMHSHPGAAFHSNGDIEDESHTDGIHIVVGHLDRPSPQFEASLVVKGVRKELDPNEILELAFGFDPAWLDKITPVSTSHAAGRSLRSSE